MNDMEAEQQESHFNSIGTAAFGLFLILLGAGIVYFAKDIRVFSFGNNDPGPKAVPLGTGVILFVGGVLQIVVAFAREGLLDRLRTKSKSEKQSVTKLKPATARILWMLGTMVAYVFLLNTIGFAASTSLFLVATLKLFGSGWKEAGMTTIVIVAFVYLLFEVVFKVSLPTGSLF